MAIFVFFAWMIEAADALGMIEIEAQDPASRAYRLAHHGLDTMKVELLGAPVEFWGEREVRVKRPGYPVCLVVSHPDGSVTRQSDGHASEVLLELGKGGGVDFHHDPRVGLDVHVLARTDDGGSYDVRMTIPPWTSRGSPRLES